MTITLSDDELKQIRLKARVREAGDKLKRCCKTAEKCCAWIEKYRLRLSVDDLDYLTELGLEIANKAQRMVDMSRRGAGR